MDTYAHANIYIYTYINLLVCICLHRIHPSIHPASQPISSSSSSHLPLLRPHLLLLLLRQLERRRACVLGLRGRQDGNGVLDVGRNLFGFDGELAVQDVRVGAGGKEGLVPPLDLGRQRSIRRADRPSILHSISLSVPTSGVVSSTLFPGMLNLSASVSLSSAAAAAAAVAASLLFLLSSSSSSASSSSPRFTSAASFSWRTRSARAATMSIPKRERKRSCSRPLTTLDSSTNWRGQGQRGLGLDSAARGLTDLSLFLSLSHLECLPPGAVELSATTQAHPGVEEFGIGEVSGRGSQKPSVSRVEPNPIQSNPIQSNPIQSNSIQPYFGSSARSILNAALFRALTFTLRVLIGAACPGKDRHTDR